MSVYEDNVGYYLLLFRLTEDIDVRVGSLGEESFDAGQYVYVGSAKRYLRQRVERHMRTDKTTRWHIDYLTTHPASTSGEALLYPLWSTTECELSARLSSASGVVAPMPGFGASDCKAGCLAHLWYLSDSNGAPLEELRADAASSI